MSIADTPHSRAPQNFVSPVKASIYACYFAPTAIFSNRIYRPLQVGAAISQARLPMLNDDIGENISALNASFCEMTAIYWAWKNDLSSSHLGFCHYRRFFSLKPEIEAEIDAHGLVYADSIDTNFESQFGLAPDLIDEVLKTADLILPYKFDVRDVGSFSVEDQYCTATFHHKEHLALTRLAVCKIWPDDLEYFDGVMSGTTFYPTNMFVMSRTVFQQYCEWIFPVLFRLESEIDVNGLSSAERRAVGYIAERLLTVFISKLQSEDQKLCIRETARIYVKNTVPAPIAPPLPETDLPIVSVVASTDEAYSPHLSALIRSVAANMSPDFWLDFVVLCSKLTTDTISNLYEVANNCDRMTLSLVDMSGELTSVNVHSYFPAATLYRLKLSDVLHNRDKVIFLDTDGIVLEDLSSLWNMDLEGNLIAAVHDPIMESFRNKEVKVMAECGDLIASTYCSDYLHMGEHSHRYFQAGFLVMDLLGMRQENMSSKLVKAISSRPYWFLDQDVLNEHFVGRVKFLARRWNTVVMDKNHLRYISNALQIELQQAKNNPAFVHFAGAGKPWSALGHEFSRHYWKYLRSTPFYELTLIRTASLSRSAEASGTSLRDLESFKERWTRRLNKFKRSIRKRLFKRAPSR